MKNVSIKCSLCNSKWIVNKKFNLCSYHNNLRLSEKKVVKPAKKIKSISDKNRLKCSDGSYITRQELEKKYREICNEIKLEREPVCEGTGRNDFPLSFSHTISRKRCVELGKAELIYDKNNLELEGFHEPTSKPIAAHNIWETGTWEEKIKLLNIQRKLDYIELHDQEQYKKIKFKLFEIGFSIV